MKLLYLDDNIDTVLEKYLVNFCDERSISYSHWDFENEKTSFIDLIMSDQIRNSNILIIDSFLFESRNGGENRFMGEELYLILKKIYPFIEVIVISNKSVDTELGDIIIKRKYLRGRKHTDELGIKHYDENLKIHLDCAIESIEAWLHIKDKISKSSTFDTVLVDKLNSSFNGNTDYDNLQKSDIDELIKVLKGVL